ncbi:MAG: hypothetical protein QM813_21845 [Verrucomicrobiota bacterium]
MTESEIKEMRRKLDEQYKKDRETLDRMLDFMHRSKSPISPPPSNDDVAPLTINERIANYIFEMDGNFTMQDAWRFIKERDPEFANNLNRQTMSTGLWRMNKDGKIKIIIPKRGKSAAIYSKV